MWVVGADEVGRGSLSGPCTVAAVLAPTWWKVEELDDSKKLCRSPKKIQRVYDRIFAARPFISWWTASRSNYEIDEYGIQRCLEDAFIEVIEKALVQEPTAEVIVDGSMNLHGMAYTSLPKADSLIPAVMAASVVAKVERDRWMREVAHPQYPEYGWDSGVGYLTATHLEALERFGPCDLHRVTFRPIPQIVRKRAVREVPNDVPRFSR